MSQQHSAKHCAGTGQWLKLMLTSKILDKCDLCDLYCGMIFGASRAGLSILETL